MIIATSITDGPMATVDPQGRDWLVACDAGLTFRVTGKDDEGIRWTGGSLGFSGGWNGTVPLTASGVADLLGGAIIRTSDERYAAVRFTAPGPFRLVARFRYVPAGGGRERTVEYTHDCVPPGGALSGRYVLRTINGTPVPARSQMTGGVEYDTLTFLPNMTYTMSGKAVDAPATSSGPTPYRIPSAETVDLITIGPGTVAGTGSVKREAGWLVFTEAQFGGPAYVWRFERVN